jgi:hypothetical protein
MIHLEIEIETLVEEKITADVDAYVHLNGNRGKILVRVYGGGKSFSRLFETDMLEEMGVERFADAVVLAWTFA